MKGREDADYDKSFTFAFLRVIYFYNPFLEGDDLRAVIPKFFASAKSSFQFYQSSESLLIMLVGLFRASLILLDWLIAFVITVICRASITIVNFSDLFHDLPVFTPQETHTTI